MVFLNADLILFFVSLEETPKGQARTDEPNTTPLRGMRAGKSFLLSFVLCSLVYVSSLFAAITLICGLVLVLGRARRKFF